MNNLNNTVIATDIRDIASSVNSSTPLEVADLGLEFSDKGVGTSFLIRDVVLEYRAGAGIKKVKGTGTNTFNSSYMETYVSAGIPERVHDWIVKKASKVCGVPVERKSIGVGLCKI
ncbi:hypothetical protein [Absidia glauca]|uniref:Uncharacterized protein n=1 Tax=Absidia glauca TaxID=4829 RepID=A0A163LUI4_ABSGL|nr:hypothetical protein [Absidia glauca]